MPLVALQWLQWLPALEVTRAFDLSVDVVVPAIRLGMVQLCLLDLKNSCESPLLVSEGSMAGIGFDIGVSIGIGSVVEWMEDTADGLGELVRYHARTSLRRSMQEHHRQIEEEDSAIFLQHSMALLVPLSRKSTTWHVYLLHLLAFWTDKSASPATKEPPPAVH